MKLEHADGRIGAARDLAARLWGGRADLKIAREADWSRDDRRLRSFEIRGEKVRGTNLASGAGSLSRNVGPRKLNRAQIPPYVPPVGPSVTRCGIFASVPSDTSKGRLARRAKKRL